MMVVSRHVLNGFILEKKKFGDMAVLCFCFAFLVLLSFSCFFLFFSLFFYFFLSLMLFVVFLDVKSMYIVVLFALLEFPPLQY